MNERDEGHDLFGDSTRGSANDPSPNAAQAGAHQAVRPAARRNTPKAEAAAEPQPDLFGFAAPASAPATKPATQRPARATRENDGEIEAREDGLPREQRPKKPTPIPDAPKRRGRGVLPAVATQDTLDVAAARP
ncbi:hypothetical protein ACLFKT_46885, partial [Paraburkholderia sp. BR14261]